MAASFTQDEMISIGNDKVIVTGTYSLSGAGTLTIQGVTEINYFNATPTTNASAIKVSISANAITITTVAGDSGTWVAIATAG